ncbi:hypothetical protein ACLMJK_006350 [Lecanora helva]
MSTSLHMSSSPSSPTIPTPKFSPGDILRRKSQPFALIYRIPDRRLEVIERIWKENTWFYKCAVRSLGQVIEARESEVRFERVKFGLSF